MGQGSTSCRATPATPYPLSLCAEGLWLGKVTLEASAGRQWGRQARSEQALPHLPKADSLPFGLSVPASVSETPAPWTADPAATCPRPSPSITSLCPPT